MEDPGWNRTRRCGVLHRNPGPRRKACGDPSSPLCDCDEGSVGLRSLTPRASPVRSRSLSLAQPLLLALVICNLIITQSVKCAPLQRRSTSSSTSYSIQTYLLKFGYLPQSGFEIRAQVSEERMKEAIRSLQTFAKISVTGMLDPATERLLRRPRCGVPDKLSGQFGSRQKRFIVQGQKWQNTSLTWSLVKSTASHREADVIKELREALGLWSKSTPLRFTFLTSERAHQADIRVIFQRGRHDDGYPFDGKGSILAHAFFPGSGTGGDAHFDDDEIWTVTDSQDGKEGTRLFAVAAHEFGHSLGLSHSDVEGSLMYPWYQNFGYDYPLHRDDELGIQRIYGSTSKFAPNPYYPGNTPLRPPAPTPPPPPPRGDGGKPGYNPERRPNTCDSSYDAISVIRNELFIFKGPYFWRLNNHQLLKGYPSRIQHMWTALPENITHVDAVYEHNDEIVFFIGQRYWRFKDGITLRTGFPRNITTIGISPKVQKIDGSMIWGHNGKTYLFSGSKYWRLREDSADFRIEPDYPRDMFVWKGVPDNIDSVFKWKDNNVYFFKGKVFWKFNDQYMRVEDEEPTLSAPYWMGCTSHPLGPTDKSPTTTATASLPPTAHHTIFIATVFMVHFHAFFQQVLCSI